MTHPPKHSCSSIQYNKFLLGFVRRNREWVAIYYHSENKKQWVWVSEVPQNLNELIPLTKCFSL